MTSALSNYRRFAAALALASLVAGPAGAQPSPPLRIVVPYAAGGIGDLVARTLAEPVGARLGQSVVVENKPGSATVVGAQAVATAPADGNTVLLVAASFVITPSLLAKIPYDVNKDFAPLTLLASNPHLLVVHPSVPAASFKEFVTWTGTKNGTAAYASFGNASSGHLGFEMLKRSAGLDMIHVPYKGGAPAIADLIGGQVQAMLTDLPQGIPHVKAGKLKALAVADDHRAAALPEVPTFGEVGLPQFESKSWYGLLARSGTSPERLARLHVAFVDALKDPAVRPRLEQAGLDLIGSTPQAFGNHLRSEGAKYAEAARVSGAKLD
jgi:tripartite-type tricarboxylate transporter receptor subunit TctC